jgi:hypothetical protein
MVQSRVYRSCTGSAGEQLTARECPNCGITKPGADPRMLDLLTGPLVPVIAAVIGAME